MERCVIVMHCYALFLWFACFLPTTTLAFWTCHNHNRRTIKQQHYSFLAAVPRYGPPDPIDAEIEEPNDAEIEDSDDLRQEITDEFRSLIEKLLVIEQQHVPSLLTNNMELLFAALPKRDILESIVEENPKQEEEVIAIINYLGTFVEAFLEEAKAVDKGYKELLGDIIRVMRGNDEEWSKWSNKEEDLDEFLAIKSDDLTPGFLRHLEGECDRIEGAPEKTPDSLHLLNIMRMIRVRVVEEVGKKTLGQGAEVLSQLLSYDEEKERMAVMTAGLELRGLEFAGELESMSQEALERMEKIEEVDPELVYRLTGIHEGIQKYIKSKKP